MRSAAWQGDWQITQPWGPTTLTVEPRYLGGYWHCGVDVGMPVGTPLYAVRAGTVEHRTSGILGLLVASGEVDYYVHGNYTVLLGQRVAYRTPLGFSGAVIPGGGHLTGPHLHFEVQRSGTQINTPPGRDPMPVLDPQTYGPGSGTVVPDFMAALTDAQQVALYQTVIKTYEGMLALAAAIKLVGTTGGAMTAAEKAELDEILATVQKIDRGE